MAGERRMFRALGGVDTGSAVPPGEAAEALRAEFERAFALKASLHDEAAAPVSPTGRRTTADAEAKLPTLVASVEGASRLAIRLGLLDPGQVRAIWSEAIGRGLYEGWDGGQSAYAAGVGGVEGRRAFPGPEPRPSGRPKTPSSRRGRVVRERQGSAAAEIRLGLGLVQPIVVLAGNVACVPYSDGQAREQADIVTFSPPDELASVASQLERHTPTRPDDVLTAATWRMAGGCHSG